MNIKNIQSKIMNLGGTYQVNGQKLVGQVGKYQINFIDGDDFVMTRKDGTKFDMGSDYNPSGYEYYSKIKDLDRLLR